MEMTQSPFRCSSISSTVRVTGQATATPGTDVCRSGSTTGWHCGKVTAVDVTANYGAGPVEGLVLTTACSEAGDSGGPFFLGRYAGGDASYVNSLTCNATGSYQRVDTTYSRNFLNTWIAASKK